MKNMLFLCVVFTIISHEAYSQYLVKDDIDIFIKEFSEIEDINSWHKPSAKAEKEWYNYIEAVSSLYKVINDIDVYLKEPKDFEKRIFVYEHIFSDLINYKVPKNLEDMYIKAGWKNNGHKKFWTICYGVVLLKNKWEIELFLGMIRDNSGSEYINEEERGLLLQEIEGITNMTNTMSANISRLLDFINENDRKIIEERLLELIDVIE